MAAAGYGCEWGDCKRPVAHLLTDMRTGATVSLCEEDYGPGLIPILANELGVDAQSLYSHVEKFLKSEAKKAEKELEAAKAAAAEEHQGQDHDDPAERADVVRQRQEAAATAGDDGPPGGDDVA